ESLQAVNMPGFVVRINHRKLLESLARYAGAADEQAGSVYRAIDKLDKIGADGAVEELNAAGIEAEAADRIIELLSLTGPPDVVLGRLSELLQNVDLAGPATDELAELFEYLAALGVPADHYALDLSLARGMGYYTGPVFE